MKLPPAAGACLAGAGRGAPAGLRRVATHHRQPVPDGHEDVSGEADEEEVAERPTQPAPAVHAHGRHHAPAGFAANRHTYRQGQASPSRAAELAGVSLYDMMVLLGAQNTPLTYDAKALAADFAEVAER